MTLKVRNKIFTIFFALSSACLLLAGIVFFVALFTNNITPPPNIRIPHFLENVAFLKFNFVATMISIFIVVIAAPLTAFYVLKYFETTQSTEIIFFIGFLTSCLCEGVRFLTPLFGLWASFTSFLFFCGRILFMGRLLAPISFVFAAIASSVNQRQDVERNLAIMYIVTLVFSLIVPINTAKITSAGEVTWGFPTIFFVLRIMCLLLAFVSFLISSKTYGTREYKKIGISMLILMIGYMILVSADNFVFFALGCPLMIFGITRYLRNLHLMYMWQ